MLDEQAAGKDLEYLRAKPGLDQPVYVQDFEWAGRVLGNDFGSL